MHRFGPFILEPRLETSSRWALLLSLISVVAALGIGTILFLIYGQNPLTAYKTILEGTLFDADGRAVIVQRAIPLLLIGIGLVFAFRAKFFNIGAEGQMLAGATAATGVALFVNLPNGLPDALRILAIFLAGFIGGSLWALIPAVLKLRLEVNEVITTLMFNYLAINLVDWLIHGPWRGKSAFGFAYTDTFAEQAWLPTLGTTRIHWPTLLIGLLLAVATSLILQRSVLGYRIRVLGEHASAARYAGISSLGPTLAVVLISGGAAGLAGAGEVAGIHHRLLDPTQVSLGYGYTAIIVAWLARGNPLGVLVSSLFMGISFAAGDIIKVALQMPFRTTDVLNGLLLFFLIGTEPLLRYRLVRAKRPVRMASDGQVG